MSWDTDKSVGDLIMSADWDAMVADQKNRSLISSGAGVPSSTPGSVGDIYIDTSALKIYIATGTSSSADWKKVLAQ